MIYNMKKLMVGALLLVSAPVAAQEHQSMIGGVPTNFSKSGVALVSAGGGICTGTLVAPKLILTAAHCLFTGSGSVIAPHKVQIAVGGRLHQTRNVYAHPAYDPDDLNVARTARNDLAIVELIDFAKVAPSAVVFGATLQVGEPLLVEGFGLNEFPIDFVGDVIKNIENFYSNGRTGIVLVNTFRTWPGVFESIYADTNTMICGGDSGGPSSRIINNRRVVVGVTSYAGLWVRDERNVCTRRYSGRSGFVDISSPESQAFLNGFPTILRHHQHLSEQKPTKPIVAAVGQRKIRVTIPQIDLQRPKFVIRVNGKASRSKKYNNVFKIKSQERILTINYQIRANRQTTQNSFDTFFYR